MSASVLTPLQAHACTARADPTRSMRRYPDFLSFYLLRNHEELMFKLSIRLKYSALIYFKA